MGIIENIRDSINSHEEAEIEKAVFKATGECIIKAAKAMSEAGIKRDNIMLLLMKHFELTYSDAEFLLNKAEV